MNCATTNRKVCKRRNELRDYKQQVCKRRNELRDYKQQNKRVRGAMNCATTNKEARDLRN